MAGTKHRSRRESSLGEQCLPLSNFRPSTTIPDDFRATLQAGPVLERGSYRGAVPTNGHFATHGLRVGPFKAQNMSIARVDLLTWFHRLCQRSRFESGAVPQLCSNAITDGAGEPGRLARSVCVTDSRGRDPFVLQVSCLHGCLSVEHFLARQEDNT